MGIALIVSVVLNIVLILLLCAAVTDESPYADNKDISV